MHKVIFYPVGNGDSSQIVLSNGKRLLFDYRQMSNPETSENPAIDLKKRLNEELKAANRDDFDVVGFTHSDDDHIAGFSDFFELLHADKYKGDGRKKIKELWVPAAVLLEPGNGNQSDDCILLRQEARYRLKHGIAIRVFSKPDFLKEWMENNGIPFEQRRHLFTDAGSLAPGFSLAADGVEFFCHSPFVKHCDDKDILRNEASLIFQIRFEVNGYQTDYFAVGDSTWDVLGEIVEITQAHDREDRLQWHLFKAAHHCSYLALSDEKGERETIPKERIKQLLLSGQSDAYIVSSSKPIPDRKEMYNETQPPHIQARKTYEEYLKEVDGRKFLVAMEEPNANKPKPLEFEISGRGIRFLGATISGAAAIISSTPPRAG